MDNVLHLGRKELLFPLFAPAGQYSIMPLIPPSLGLIIDYQAHNQVQSTHAQGDLERQLEGGEAVCQHIRVFAQTKIRTH